VTNFPSCKIENYSKCARFLPSKSAVTPIFLRLQEMLNLDAKEYVVSAAAAAFVQLIVDSTMIVSQVYAHERRVHTTLNIFLAIFWPIFKKKKGIIIL
jgi:hypothetical protein